MKFESVYSQGVCISDKLTPIYKQGNYSAYEWVYLGRVRNASAHMMMDRMSVANIINIRTFKKTKLSYRARRNISDLCVLHMTNTNNKRMISWARFGVEAFDMMSWALSNSTICHSTSTRNYEKPTESCCLTPKLFIFQATNHFSI